MKQKLECRNRYRYRELLFLEEVVVLLLVLIITHPDEFVSCSFRFNI